jgi:hypothetical protein
VHVWPFLIAYAETAKLIQPCEGTFHDPAPSPEPAAMFSVALRKKREDASVTQTLPDGLRVITTVAQYAIRTMARSSSLSLQGWDSVNQCKGLLRVVTIGSGQLNGERNPATVAD